MRNRIRSKFPLFSRRANIRNKFSVFSRRTNDWFGSPSGLIISGILLVIWLATGIVYGFSANHQLALDTFAAIHTCIVTPLLLYAQSRDTQAFHLKLNELVYSKPEARNELIALEKAEDAKLEEIAKSFEELSKKDED
jgi:low affinity Fe/Cu permease